MRTIPSMAGYFAAALIVRLPVPTVRADKRTIGFFVGDSDAYACVQAVGSLDLPQVDLAVLTREDILTARMKQFLQRMDVAYAISSAFWPIGIWG